MNIFILVSLLPCALGTRTKSKPIQVHPRCNSKFSISTIHQ